MIVIIIVAIRVIVVIVKSRGNISNSNVNDIPTDIPSGGFLDNSRN